MLSDTIVVSNKNIYAIWKTKQNTRNERLHETDWL